MLSSARCIEGRCAHIHQPRGGSIAGQDTAKIADDDDVVDGLPWLNKFTRSRF